MSKECGLGQKCISVFELHQLIYVICLLEKLGLQPQPSVSSSVGTFVGAAAGPLRGKSDIYIYMKVMNFSTSALPLFLLPASVVIFGWIHEICSYKHPVLRMSLMIYMYRCMVPRDRSYS